MSKQLTAKSAPAIPLNHTRTEAINITDLNKEEVIEGTKFKHWVQCLGSQQAEHFIS
jgi:hypothetical protein